MRSILQEDGTTVTLEYDKAGNPTGIDYAGDTVRFTYDSLGNLTSAQDASGTIEYYYDAHANPVIETQRGIDVNRRFDRATGAQEALAFLGRSVSYERDDKGKLAALRTPAQTIAFSRDASGLLSERNYPNQTKETFAYDETYNLTRIETGELNFEYAHDKSGLITQKNENTFVYDKAGRLTQSPNESFEYDAAGNLLDEKNRYDTLNHRLMENETHTFEYDARGNLSLKRNKQTKETTRYAFDARNRLTEVVTTDRGNIPIKRFAFAYDALGRRISKTENGTTQHYLYDKANIVAILDENDEVLATIIHDEGTDLPLSITVYDKPEDLEAHAALSEDERFLAELKLQRTYWYHRDHQGSIVALTDKAGTIVESFIYDDAYGKILDHHKSVETYNPYGYTGREYDAPDLYYYRARYYDPNTARFLSEDPIEFLSGDFNFYRYVENNPVNFIDPLGFKAQSPLCKSIERKMKTLERKAIAPLKKMVAKQMGKMALAPVPLLGWAMAAWTAYDLVDLITNLNSLLKEFDLLDLELKACEKKEKKAAESKKKDGTKIKGLKRKKVKCFCQKDKNQGGRDEYERQLKKQNEGINSMSAGEYLRERKAYTGKDPCNGYQDTPEGKTKERDPSITRKAKRQRKKELSKKYAEEFREKGQNRKEAKRLGAKKAQLELKNQAALHNQDMVAGGYDVIGTLQTDSSRVLTDADFGPSDINSHIGSQWNGPRIRSIDEQACEAVKEGKGQEKMNVELRACGKKEAKKNGCK